MNIRHYVPRLFLHIFDSESKSVSFGWVLYLSATYGSLFARDIDHKPLLDSDKWMWTVVISSLLVGGKMAKEALADFIAAKFPKPPAAPETPSAPVAA